MASASAALASDIPADRVAALRQLQATIFDHEQRAQIEREAMEPAQASAQMAKLAAERKARGANTKAKADTPSVAAADPEGDVEMEPAAASAAAAAPASIHRPNPPKGDSGAAKREKPEPKVPTPMGAPPKPISKTSWVHIARCHRGRTRNAG